MKKTHFYLILIIMLFCSEVRGQEIIDSLDYYYKTGDFKKAISIGEKTKNELEKSKLSNTEGYSKILNYLSVIYLNNKNFELAEEIFKEAVQLEKLIDKKSLNYAISLYNLGDFYSKKGDFVLAEYSFLESIKILETNLELDRQFLMDCYTKTGSLYFNYDEISKSEVNYKKAVQIAKVLYGENDLEYASVINNLGVYYKNIGNYKKAEELLLKSYEIRKNDLNADIVKTSILLINLGGLKEGLGNYFEAEKFYLNSIELLKIKNNLNYSRAIGILGHLYLKQNKLTQAKSLFEQEVEINKNIAGENNIDYAQSLSNLASYYNFNKEYLKSIEINTKVLEIRRNLFGENHTKYAFSLNHLANSYNFLGDYKKSEDFFLKSLLVFKKSLGENSFDYLASLNNIIELYINQNQFLEASNYIELSFNPFRNQIYNFINFSSSNELSDVKTKYAIFKVFPFSFLQMAPNKFSDINIGCFEQELLLKNLVLRNQQQITKSIEKSNNIGLQSKYKQFVYNKRHLIKLNEIPINNRPTNYEQIKLETETLEKYLVTQSSISTNSKKDLLVNWRQIQKKLKPKEIAIDFVTFNYYNKKWTDSIVYASFIIGKDFKFPKFISLFEEKQLALLLDRSKNQQASSSIDKQYLDKAISDLFLKPLEKELEGISTIYLSPSGLGHQINFAALPVNDNQTLGNKYKLHILSSPAELIDYSSAKFEKGNNLELLLYGGIDYDKVNSIPNTNFAKTENNGSQTELQTRSGITGFGYLKGSKKEVEQIQFKGTQNGFKTTLLNDRIATEESIKQLDGRTTPFILHLATHGFFFPDPNKEAPKNIFDLEGKSKIYKASDDPMMRSGLLFAGANKFWGKTTENTTTDDGILTASEISNLDLSACQLVVLSACETGLGEVKGSEGVFGLQRAFKMAGVKNIIMSLWKVPDTQTAELFDIFYSECFAGKTIHEAFKSAQTKMKAKYSPYYWAGFVLLE